MVTRATSRTHTTVAAASQHPRSSRLSPRPHVPPVAIPISHRCAATKVGRDRERSPSKQGLLDDGSTHVHRVPRDESIPSFHLTRQRHASRACDYINTAASVARRHMPSLTGTTHTTATAHPHGAHALRCPCRRSHRRCAKPYLALFCSLQTPCRCRLTHALATDCQPLGGSINSLRRATPNMPPPLPKTATASHGRRL